MTDIGKALIGVGVGLAVLGGVLWLSGSTLKHIPLGRLPGDIWIQNDRITFYFPFTTGILLSIGVSLLLWLGRAIANRS